MQDSSNLKLADDAATLTNIPLDLKSSDRALFYGWTFNDAFIKKFITNHKIKVFDLEISNALVLEHLRKESGFKHIHMTMGRWHDKVPSDRCIIAEDQQPCLHLITVACTISKPLLRRRPSEGQMKHLIALLGEPDWYEDYFEKKHFPWEIVG